MLDFGRGLCCDLHVSGGLEWLVTNGIGGYAMGTVAGVLTRRYHGLLIAALQPPVVRALLVTKLDETAQYAGRSYRLCADPLAASLLPEPEEEPVEPLGPIHLERFCLEGTTPVWTFALADAILEKRVWMQHGANTTYVQYAVRRGSSPLTLDVQALVNYRDHHGNTHLDTHEGLAAWHGRTRVQAVPHGVRVIAHPRSVPFYLLSDRAVASPRYAWRKGYSLDVEEYVGLDPLDDNLEAGAFRATLQPGEPVTFVATTEAGAKLDGATALAERRAYETELLHRARPALAGAPQPIEHLVLAADQFVVRRPVAVAAEARVVERGEEAGATEESGRSVIAGYPWFGDWGRDTMIALPGLTLATGRYEVAERILRTFGLYVDRGMIPNRFPDEGQAPEYNTVDATLWYFEAIRAYHAATSDYVLVRDLFPVLQDIVDWHVRGTRYQIHVDPADGLLYAGEQGACPRAASGVQLTWMDAKVDDWVVTPRIGKPVEVNALWYNALRIMAEFARLLAASSVIPAQAGIQEPAPTPEPYDARAEQARAGFARFWNEETGFCYDVLDGPDGNDPSLRPNQLFAVSLRHSPLPEEQRKAVVDACARHLLTSHGLRSLDPRHPDYKGHHGGDRRTRDAAYHQGTVWGWLIGPFVSAHLRVYGDPALARSFLAPLIQELDAHCVGSLSEIFDGDPPFTPRGCIAQAWTVAEVLRVWKETG